jgi:hypothetical protein
VPSSRKDKVTSKSPAILASMTNSEFLAWADMAEQLRNKTLSLAEEEKRNGRELDLTEYIRKLNEL